MAQIAKVMNMDRLKETYTYAREEDLNQPPHPCCLIKEALHPWLSRIAL